MDIVVLSGKGGTGKTTVATNLARRLKMAYIDCDVEEPNGHIFLKPIINEEIDTEILNPVFDTEKCITCGKCVELCQFNALAKVLTSIMLFKELCHGCGACSIACKEGAITEIARPIGKISIGESAGLPFMSGKLNISEPMGGPVISQLKKESKFIQDKIFDASPGTSCSVVKTLNAADYALLVTEPSAFGLHDLKLAVELVRNMKIPHGVIVNRKMQGIHMIHKYCLEEEIDIIGEIPFSREAAEAYSQGNLLIENKEYKLLFDKIAKNLLNKINGRSDHASCDN